MVVGCRKLGSERCGEAQSHIYSAQVTIIGSGSNIDGENIYRRTGTLSPGNRVVTITETSSRLNVSTQAPAMQSAMVRLYNSRGEGRHS